MARRKYCKLIIFFSILIASFCLLPMSGQASEKVKLYLFYSNSCPHCRDEKEFLNQIRNEYSNLEIELLEVTENPANSELLDKVKTALGTENNYVPYTVIGKIGLTGYNENIAGQIEHFIKRFSNEKTIDVVEKIRNGEKIENLEEDTSNNSSKEEIEEAPITVPILGKINPKKVSLPILAVIMGFIDGFNPCAMWVLLFLISMLIGMKDRKKMWIMGITFLLTSALIYLLFMISWLKIAISITSITWIQKLIALVALLAGIWNLYGFYKAKDAGCTIVKEEKRKRTLSQIKRITSESRFLLAILGVMLLAISVNIVELACSSGLPLVFTQVLALNNLTAFEYGTYIFFYILFFLIDDLFVFFIAMVTMKVTGISNKYAKYSHLIGGIIMVLIGILLFFKPEWLMLNFS